MCVCDHLFALLSGLQLEAGLISGPKPGVSDDVTSLTPVNLLMERLRGEKERERQSLRRYELLKPTSTVWV